jgi:hypothetical protein
MLTDLSKKYPNRIINTLVMKEKCIFIEEDQGPDLGQDPGLLVYGIKTIYILYILLMSKYQRAKFVYNSLKNDPSTRRLQSQRKISPLI